MVHYLAFVVAIHVSVAVVVVVEPLGGLVVDQSVMAETILVVVVFDPLEMAVLVQLVALVIVE